MCIVPCTDGGYICIKTWPYGPKTVDLGYLVSISQSDWRKHPRMVIITCNIASGVDHLGFGTDQATRGSMLLYLIVVPVLYQKSHGMCKSHRRRVKSTNRPYRGRLWTVNDHDYDIVHLINIIYCIKILAYCPWNYALTTL